MDEGAKIRKLLVVKLMIFFLLTVPIAAQHLRIGQVEFSNEGHPDKPAGTLTGYIQVYEDCLGNSGRSFNLCVEVLPAKNPVNKAAPIFIIMGGPGQAATDLMSFFHSIFARINETRDLVFIDQRGTGRSNPLKINREYTALQNYFEDIYLLPKIIQEARDHLNNDYDLRCYTTRYAVQDIETVRESMGYDKINLYGTSYGTRVALSYINSFPDKVRTATLKGLVPNSLVIPHPFAHDAQRSLDSLVNTCLRDEVCRTTYPQFKEELDELLHSSFPINVTLPNAETGLDEGVQIGRDDFTNTLRSLLGAPSMTQQIPYLVSEAHQQHFTPLAQLILRIQQSRATALYDGMRLSVICYEDYPRLSGIPSPGTEGTFLGRMWIDRVINACQIWNPDKELSRLVKSERQTIPVLLISGGRDPATPPSYGEEVIRYFPNGRHLIIDQAAHSFDGMLGCVDDIINDFVISGQVTGLMTDCVETIRYPEFKID